MYWTANMIFQNHHTPASIANVTSTACLNKLENKVNVCGQVIHVSQYTNHWHHKQTRQEMVCKTYSSTLILPFSQKASSLCICLFGAGICFHLLMQLLLTFASCWMFAPHPSWQHVCVNNTWCHCCCRADIVRVGSFCKAWTAFKPPDAPNPE